MKAIGSPKTISYHDKWDPGQSRLVTVRVSVTNIVWRL